MVRERTLEVSENGKKIIDKRNIDYITERLAKINTEVDDLKKLIPEEAEEIEEAYQGIQNSIEILEEIKG